jgi:galactose mutarotase-like enzyme
MTALPTSFAAAEPVTLENSTVRLTVWPSIGAKVSSLYDRVRGEEWLAPAQRPLAAPDPGGSFEDYDCSGWDECFPNVAVGPHPINPDELLPDHGEVWSRPWDVVHLERTSVTTAIVGQVLPCRLTRTLRLREGGVTAEYLLENLSDVGFGAAWLMHPLLGLRTPTRVRLPTGTTVRRDPDVSGRPAELTEWRPWQEVDPSPGGDQERGLAVKLFTRPDGPRVAVVERPGAALAFALPTNTALSFGIWLNDGGWPVLQPQRQLAVEPAFGCADRLDRAIAEGTALTLDPGGSRQWQVELDFLDPGLPIYTVPPAVPGPTDIEEPS